MIYCSIVIARPLLGISFYSPETEGSFHISESKTLITNLSQKEMQGALWSMQRAHLLSLLRNCVRLPRSNTERFRFP